MSKILFLVSSMHGGGAERIASLLCNHWAQQGHNVTLMPTFSGRGGCLYSLHSQVCLDYLADRVGKTGRSAMNMMRRFIALRQAIKEIKPEKVVSFLPHVNVAVLLASRGLKIPVVVAERTYPPAMPLGMLLEQMRSITYPWAKNVILQTEEGCRWLTTQSPRAKGIVIANPLVYPLPENEPVVAPASVLDISRRVLLAVGRLGEEKGFHDLLVGFAALVNKFTEWDLVILGEGSERDRLEKQCLNLGLDGRVFLPGRVGNVADWYHRADLYVMSSHFEGFPNTLLEAMAHGLPAVSMDCKTGPCEIISHERDGLLVCPSLGVQGLSEALTRLMDDAFLRKRMASEAIAVRERFAMDRIIKQWNMVLGLGTKVDSRGISTHSANMVI